jgi:hypothetical protein
MIEAAKFGPKDQYHQVMVHQRVAVSYVASFAMDLIKSAICQGIPNSKGDGFERMLTPQEVVERATTTASIAFEDFQKRGWIIEQPALERLNTNDKVGF